MQHATAISQPAPASMPAHRSRAAGQSTGPRTPEGKQKSSQNSTKHGCCSHRLLLPGEDPAAWEELKAGWLQEYEAANQAALSLVLQAAEAQWMLVRAHNHFAEAHHKLYQKFQRYLGAAEHTPSSVPFKPSNASAALTQTTRGSLPERPGFSLLRADTRTNGAPNGATPSQTGFPPRQNRRAREKNRIESGLALTGEVRFNISRT
jgi:hypothetical protein